MIEFINNEPMNNLHESRTALREVIIHLCSPQNGDYFKSQIH